MIRFDTSGKFLIVLLVLAVILLASCSALPATDPDSIGTAVVATFSIQFTRTAAAILPGTPTPAGLLTPGASPAPSVAPASPSPTPGADFSSAILLLTDTTTEGESRLLLLVPGLGQDSHEYTGRLSGADYPCDRDGNDPERLSCVGPRMSVLDVAVFVPLG